MATLLDLIDRTITLVSSPKSRHLEFDDVMKEIPTIDLEPLINHSKDTTAVQSVCKQIVESLHKYGILIVKDNRLTTEKSNKFINMMEDYFNRTESEKMKDVFPDLHYQVGATPQLTEIPRNHCDKIQTLDPTHRPLTSCPPEGAV